MAMMERSVGVHLGAFPVDPDFPQLEVACDPVRMLEIFRQHLRPVSGKDVRILECAASRFRCHQSDSRCVLQYTLRLEEPGTGSRWEQWVTGLIYAEPGEAGRLWRKLLGTEAVREISEPWGGLEPVSFIPELDMVVEVFPFDHRLPQLSRVLDGASRDITTLLVDRLESGHWPGTPPAIEPSRYRAELRAVLQFAMVVQRPESGHVETRRWYLKAYRDQSGGEAFDRLTKWTREDRRGYSLVRPIAYMEKLRILVMEEAPGLDLRRILLFGDDPVTAVADVARAVAAFHQDDLDITRTSEPLDRLREASDLAQWACPEERARIAGVTAVVARNLEEVQPAPTHGNLRTDSVFLSGDKVVLLGGESFERGDPVRDAARLFASIAGRAGLDAMAPDRAHELAAAFADEYFRHVPASWRRRFRWLCAGAFIEEAAEAFRSQEPEWRRQVAELSASAQRALTGRFG